MSTIGLRRFRLAHSSLGAAMWVAVLSMLVLCSVTLRAQVIKIKLVDGKSGRPIAHSCVNVWVGHQRKEAMTIPTDSSGIASLRLTDRDDEVDAHNPWKDCGMFGVIGPVVLYAESIRINTSFASCQARPSPNSWLAITGFSTAQLIHDGIVTPNACGKSTASPRARGAGDLRQATELLGETDGVVMLCVCFIAELSRAVCGRSVFCGWSYHEQRHAGSGQVCAPNIPNCRWRSRPCGGTSASAGAISD